ncbi:MAG: HAD hydrolase-like protein [Planctomycetota bacterium]|nr:HAD hydrolase-like protein [Planctomycetota bacterium]MDA1178294.1 HAD hydrolase-like protein [Planctomycetota bacterium]
MSDQIEGNYQRVADVSQNTHFLRGTGIEVIHAVSSALVPEHVLFDFDGTLSLIREGWPEVMIPMMVDVLLGTGTRESAETVQQIAHQFVMELNGKQTIYQMIRLAEEVSKRGGTPQDPQVYKQKYHDLLMERINVRRAGLAEGTIQPQEMTVPGTFALLDALQHRGARLYLASGTDEAYVKEEVALLQLDRYFGQHVYGAQTDYRSFSKAQVIERILSTHKVDGSRLVGFGDGYVEIQNVKAVGGTAIAVASDEANRSGKPDPWKRDRLIGVGADLVIPDYQDAQALVDYLWSAEKDAGTKKLP